MGRKPIKKPIKRVVKDKTIIHHFAEPLRLDCGRSLPQFDIAYCTYGRLNKDKSNAILVCHGLTGDQYAAGRSPLTGKAGWWARLIGPGKILDTKKYFIIAPNSLGSCLGTTGPASINPKTKKPWGLDFPVITIADMVRAQKRLIDALGIEKLFCVMGGSMGGMQTLQWSIDYPEQVFSAIPIATSSRHSAQNIAFYEIGRQAIMADPDWRGGAYYRARKRPRKGLAVARMTAHITYLSEIALQRKFGRNLQNRQELSYGFDADFQIESYLHHQGYSFVERFDANSYIYITRAMDYFDIAADYDGVLARAFQDCEVRFCVVSFTSDWHFPTSESITLVRALNAASVNVSFVEIESDKGHDAFLLDEPEMNTTIDGFLTAAARDWLGHSDA